MADMYRLRDAAANAHWNKLADSLMSCLSGTFTEGTKRDLFPAIPFAEWRSSRSMIPTQTANGEQHFEVVGDALAEYLVGAEHESGFLCINSLGRPWKIENSLQRSSSDYLTGFARKGIIEPGLTLHGLRVSFVSSIKRAGGDDRMVADPTGEQSISMGVRYTRHVVKEGNIAKVYDLVKQRQENEK